MFIIRRSNYINTVSGIVFSVSDRPVCTPDASLILVFSVSDRPVCTPEGHLHRILCQMLY